MFHNSVRCQKYTEPFELGGRSLPTRPTRDGIDQPDSPHDVCVVSDSSSHNDAVSDSGSHNDAVSDSSSLLNNRFYGPKERELLLKHQWQLTALQSWSVYWGVYCRRTATKENQDGWFVLRSFLKNGNDTDNNPKSDSNYGKDDYGGSHNWGCWNYEMQLNEDGQVCMRVGSRSVKNDLYFYSVPSAKYFK